MSRSQSCRRGKGRFVAGLSVTLAGTLVGATPPPALAQAPGTIVTIAGKIGAGSRESGVPATEAQLRQPYGPAVDAQGNVFIPEAARHIVSRVDAATGTLTFAVGTGEACPDDDPCGTGGPAVQAQLVLPKGVIIDSEGSLYVMETASGNRIRKVRASDGTVLHIAGRGTERVTDETCLLAGYANLAIVDMAIDPAGHLFVLTPDVLYRVDADSRITAVAAAGRPPVMGNGDGGPAMAAVLQGPRAVATDAGGNLYLSEATRIRRIAAGIDGAVTGGSDEIITTVAGTGTAGAAVDGVPARESPVRGPQDLVVDTTGDLFIADTGNNAVRRVEAGADGVITGAADEIITTVAGGGTESIREGGPAVGVFLGPWGLGLDRSGNLLVTDGTARVFRVFGVAGAPPAVGKGPDLPQGDLNGDGRVNIQDATLSLQIVVGNVTPTQSQVDSADVNGDGRVSTGDATLILQAAVGNRSSCF